MICASLCKTNDSSLIPVRITQPYLIGKRTVL
uniref:Uncharacterized protein n=1 Tax=Anguilla anguilla TaxID=7936 RepID=A0A0E9VXS4_ANGAN